MNDSSSLRKNPSRKSCEETIRRILVTEVLTKGKNEQFRQASDFMSYFESLYPASESLSKQVQRAIASMHMPKDEKGYFIINKSEEQLSQEKDLSFLLKKGQASLCSLDGCEPLLITLDPSHIRLFMHQVSQCITFREKYVTMFETTNGVMFYTKNHKQLTRLLNSLIS